MSMSNQKRIEQVRSEIDHPIIDADGHLVESVPLLLEHVDAVGGPSVVDRFTQSLRQVFTGLGSPQREEARGPWWPAVADADYKATVMAPGRMAERLPELGIDFAVVYPSLGLALCTLPDPELRVAACRALNEMNAALCGPHRERLTCAAVVPMHTPEEAVEVLEGAASLGFGTAMVPPAVARPVPDHPDAFPSFCSLDRYGIDSAHDYDAVWQAFLDASLVVAAHGGLGFRYLPTSARSPSNYMFNHILGHAELQEHLCRALVMGGVFARFPALRISFLEGGATWALALLGAMEEHWEKRSARGLDVYDPSRLDRDRLASLLAVHGLPPEPPALFDNAVAQPWVRDEFADCGVSDEADFAAIFSQQIFLGCESDDPGVHRALDGPGNPLGTVLRPMFSSDIGHWDVPDLLDVVPNSWRGVDAGLLGRDGYRTFVFENVVELYTSANPRFFEGTAVEAAADAAGPTLPAG